MDVNDNACFLNKRAAFEYIASKLAPTRSGVAVLHFYKRLFLRRFHCRPTHQRQ
jgi:hypothetical protein